jgi:hypothetical protein
MLNKEINGGFADPSVEARLADQGATILPGSPADVGKLITDGTEKWTNVVRAANIKVERPRCPSRVLSAAEARGIKLSRAILCRLLQQSNGPYGLKSGRAFCIKQKVRVPLQAKSGLGSKAKRLTASISRPQHLNDRTKSSDARFSTLVRFRHSRHRGFV